MTATVEWLTPAQAAEHGPQYSADWYRRRLRDGTLRGSKVGGQWFTTADAIDALMQRGSNTQRRRRQRRITT